MPKLLAILLSMSLMACTDTSSQDASKKNEKMVGIKFPQISAETLAGTKIILPDSAQGKIALITIAFKREAQSQLDSWLRPFMEEYGETPGFTFYEIPMLARYWKLLGWMIDSGMRSGIEEEKHKNVMTYYGNYTHYQRVLRLNDSTFGYVFLLDREGIIRWHSRGYATQQTIKEMTENAKNLYQQK